MEKIEIKSNEEINRSKLYMLTEDNEWIDQATGTPSLEKSLSINFELKFKSEEVNNLVYDLEITKETLFTHKEENIISWFDTMKNSYMALSFQTEKGAHDFWEKIQEIKFDHPPQNGLDSLNDDSFLEQEYFGSFKEEEVDLPEPNIKNLAQIANIIQEAVEFEKKINISKFFATKINYLKSLENLFLKCEENKDLQSISQILLIIKGLISFSERTLLHLLMSDEYYLFVFGVLEYDPEIYKKVEIPHREYLQKIVKFHEIAKIQDEKILRIIHVNYRLSYLRDNALSFFLDERSMALISLAIYNIYGEIIKYIKNDRDFVNSLFKNLKTNDIMTLKLIYELFSVSKILETDRINLIEMFEECHFFEILEEILITNYAAENSNFIETKQQMHYLFEIILLILQLKPLSLNKYISSISQKIKNYPFFNFLCSQLMKNQGNDDLISFSTEIVIALLGNETTVTATPVPNNNQQIFFKPYVQQIFIDHFLEKLLNVITQMNNNVNILSIISIYLILESLAKNMGEQMKKFWIKYQNFISLFSIFKIVKNKEIILSCLKLFKSFLLINNQEMNNLLEKPFLQILDFFVSLSFFTKNLLFSIIFEIIIIVNQQKVKNLIQTMNQYFENNAASLEVKNYISKYLENMEIIPNVLKKEIKPEMDQKLFEITEMFQTKAENNEEKSKKKKSINIIIKAKQNSTVVKAQTHEILLKHKKLVDYDDEEEEETKEPEFKKRKLEGTELIKIQK